ncbi:MAG TPA: hypothetical protein ENH95_06855 [Nitrosopumilus sp.]|nr:hypothetical protein [Nitrosopumilus sp.]
MNSAKIQVLEITGIPLRKLKEKYATLVLGNQGVFEELATSNNTSTGSVYSDQMKQFFYSSDGHSCYVYFFNPSGASKIGTE